MNSYHNLNKIFDSRVRLGIMSGLIMNESMNFNQLKELLDSSDGNLACHLKTLEENKYIKVEKGFIGRKTNTIYKITKIGEREFRKHIQALEDMIKGI